MQVKQRVGARHDLPRPFQRNAARGAGRCDIVHAASPRATGEGIGVAAAADVWNSKRQAGACPGASLAAMKRSGRTSTALARDRRIQARKAGSAVLSDTVPGLTWGAFHAANTAPSAVNRLRSASESRDCGSQPRPSASHW